jgi:YhcH/YjgK/YiaL family protein
MIVTSLQTWPAQASAYHPVFRRALEFIAQHDFRHEKPGKIDIIPGKLFCLLQEMDSVPFSDARPESHRQFIDIQYLISGHEVMGVSSVSSGKHSVVEDRTPEQDILFWQVNEDENPVTLTPGMFAIFSLMTSTARAPTSLAMRHAICVKRLSKFTVNFWRKRYEYCAISR